MCWLLVWFRPTVRGGGSGQERRNGVPSKMLWYDVISKSLDSSNPPITTYVQSFIIPITPKLLLWRHPRLLHSTRNYLLAPHLHKWHAKCRSPVKGTCALLWRSQSLGYGFQQLPYPRWSRAEPKVISLQIHLNRWTPNRQSRLVYGALINAIKTIMKLHPSLHSEWLSLRSWNPA